jgi:Fanconi anemia group M protein
MEVQKVLKEEKRIMIISDYRERSIIEHLKNFDVLISERNLEVGDFICSDECVVERKTHSDFISSIIDGRIFFQAKKMRKNFKKPIVIIEGYSNRPINENAYRAALASLVVNFDISLISTRNELDTARTIYWIAKKNQEEKMQEVSIKVGRKSKNLEILKRKLVATLPGVGDTLSRRLIERFKSLEKIFNASEEELQEIKGISKRLAKNLRDFISRC